MAVERLCREGNRGNGHRELRFETLLEEIALRIHKMREQSPPEKLLRHRSWSNHAMKGR